MTQTISFISDHNPFLSTFMVYHHIFDTSDMTGATSGASISYTFGVHELSSCLVLYGLVLFNFF